MSESGYTGSYLKAADIETINAARITLAAMRREYGNTWEDGLVYAKADVAANALFELLNIARHMAGVEITDEQMHPERQP